MISGLQRKDRRGFDLISDTLPFGGLWYAGPNAISNAIEPEGGLLWAN
jgi:hypothetical protein